MESFATFRSRLMRSFYWGVLMRLSSLGSRLRTIHEFLFRAGDSELKYGASRFVRLCPQPAPMGIDDGPADRQPHSHSARLRRVESLENAIERFRINARPR